MAGKPPSTRAHIQSRATLRHSEKTHADDCVTDESIRRSGRATKGQHTKDREPSEEATSKRKVKKGKGGRKAAQDDDEEDEENAYVRCVCGIYEEEEEVERSMICCDNCSAWQHNDCMSLPDDPNYSPETYYCEQCKPEDHKELLAAIERGEKPWEEAARKREAAAALKPKKGKRGRKSAASRASQDVEDGTPARSGQKRKVEDETPAPEVKVRDCKCGQLLFTDSETGLEEGSVKCRVTKWNAQVELCTARIRLDTSRSKCS